MSHYDENITFLEMYRAVTNKTKRIACLPENSGSFCVFQMSCLELIALARCLYLEYGEHDMFTSPMNVAQCMDEDGVNNRWFRNSKSWKDFISSKKPIFKFSDLAH